MVVILPGDLTAIVPNPVEVECKPGLEPAPIHHQHMVERTAVTAVFCSRLQEEKMTRLQLCLLFIFKFLESICRYLYFPFRSICRYVNVPKKVVFSADF